jgi:hypothetical protein
MLASYVNMELFIGRSILCLLVCFSYMFREDRDTKWEEFAKGDLPWKQAVVPLMENFTERTPGSFVETKEVNIAWHVFFSYYFFALSHISSQALQKRRQ